MSDTNREQAGRLTIEQLMARAIANTDAETFRAVLTEVLVERLRSGWDLSKVIDAAVGPVIKEILRDLVQRPDIVEMIRQRAHGELLAHIGKLEFKTRGGY